MNQSQNNNKYPTMKVLMVPTKLSQVPDLATGGVRNKKYGIFLSLSAIPNLSTAPTPIVVNDDQVMMLLDSDSLDELREMCVQEIDGLIEQLKDYQTSKNEKNTVSIAQ